MKSSYPNTKTSTLALYRTVMQNKTIVYFQSCIFISIALLLITISTAYFCIHRDLPFNCLLAIVAASFLLLISYGNLQHLPDGADKSAKFIHNIDITDEKMKHTDFFGFKKLFVESKRQKTSQISEKNVNSFIVPLFCTILLHYLLHYFFLQPSFQETTATSLTGVPVTPIVERSKLTTIAY